MHVFAPKTGINKLFLVVGYIQCRHHTFGIAHVRYIEHAVPAHRRKRIQDQLRNFGFAGTVDIADDLHARLIYIPEFTHAVSTAVDFFGIEQLSRLSVALHMAYQRKRYIRAKRQQSAFGTAESDDVFAYQKVDIVKIQRIIFKAAGAIAHIPPALIQRSQFRQDLVLSFSVHCSFPSYSINFLYPPLP